MRQSLHRQVGLLGSGSNTGRSRMPALTDIWHAVCLTGLDINAWL